MGTSRRKHENTSGKGKNIISGIIAFILAVSCTLVTVILVVYFGFFNTNNIITSFNKVEYYNKVMDHFNENAWDITIPMGLPQEVLDDVANIKKVSRDVKGSLTAGLDGTDYTVDTSDLEAKLDQNVRTYFNQEGTDLNAEQEKVLSEYKATISAEYLSSVQIPLIKYFGYAKNLYKKVMFAGIPVCIILIVGAVTLLVKLRTWKHRSLRYITYSTLGTVLMTAGIPAALLISGIYKKVQLSPEYFYQFVMSYLKGGLMMFLYFALVWAIISVLFMFLIKKMRFKLMHKH